MKTIKEGIEAHQLFLNTRGLKGARFDVWYSFDEDVDFRNLDLSLSCISKSALRGRDLSGINLRGANLSGADLRGTNLTNANLEGTILNHANLMNANLTNASLKYSSMYGTNLTGAICDGADFEEAESEDIIK